MYLGSLICGVVGVFYALVLQVPPQEVFGPSKPTPKIFSEGPWRNRDGVQVGPLPGGNNCDRDPLHALQLLQLGSYALTMLLNANG